jgi:glycosyltransferase involved in cell wall biosynthesis
MTSNNLIIVACNLPQQWSTDYPYQTAKKLCKNNYVVCWMLQEIPIKKFIQRGKLPKLFWRQSKNLYVYQTIHVLPFRRFSFIRSLNIMLSVLLLRIILVYMQLLTHAKKTILWVFDPQFTYLYRLLEKNIFLVYDCIDYFQDVSDEQYLLQRSNIVTSISHTLKKIHSHIRSDIHVVPQGFRLESFEKKRTYVGPILPKNKPIIGYIGGINFRLAFTLLTQLAKRNPQYVFFLVGAIQKNNSINYEKIVRPQIKKLFKHKNIIYIPELPKEQIPGMIKQFTIAMIPYDTKFQFNRYCYPMKLFEYFYMGKPVISTPIKELLRFPKFVQICLSVPEWERAIHETLMQPWPKSYRRKQRQLAVENSWGGKIAATESILEQSLHN